MVFFPFLNRTRLSGFAFANPNAPIDIQLAQKSLHHYAPSAQRFPVSPVLPASRLGAGAAGLLYVT